MDEIDAEIAEYNRTHANEPSPRDISYGGFTYKTGDILVTSDTSFNGILGHAGIMMDGKVLEITPKHNDSKPNILSVSAWHEAYSSTLMVVRYTGSLSKAISAAQWGYSNYGATTAPYNNAKYLAGENRQHLFCRMILFGTESIIAFRPYIG